MSVMSRAASLAYYELLGDAALMNQELGHYQSVTTTDLQNTCEKVFNPSNSNTIYYLSNES